MQTLKSLCARKGVTITSQPGAPDPGPNFRGFSRWTVTLHYQDRHVRTPFYMGAALKGEPEAHDVLGSLLMDASEVEAARGFEDWASNLGLESDSREAERTYKKCVKIVPRLRRFLGDDFDEFVEAEY